MGVVVAVADFKKRDTVGVLRELLVRASRGEIDGLAFYAAMKGGGQKSGFTGRFRNDQAEAVKAANRVSVGLNQHQDANEAAVIAAGSRGDASHAPRGVVTALNACRTGCRNSTKAPPTPLTEVREDSTA